jgi:tyrocidine synthetase III
MEKLLLKLKANNIDVKVENGNLKLQIPNKLDVKDILAEVTKSKEELIAYITNMLNYNKEIVEIPNVQEQSFYTLSSAQKRMYLLQQMDLDSITYNMPYVLLLEIKRDKNKIEEVFQKLISRHESFRTSFELEGDEPVQRIHEHVDFKIENFSIEKEEEQSIRKNFIRPFELSQAPLLRVGIIEIKGESNLLMIDMHHIISDGISHSILEREFKALYSGEELLPLKLQYKDYSEWQNSEEQRDKIKSQENYWLKRFEEEIPVLNLPTDYVRPVIQSHEGATVSFTLSKEETKGIKLLSKENDLTLYMSLLSVFTILLSKLSGQDDIIIGTPIAGRNHNDLENIIGMFINTLAIRSEVSEDETIREFLSKLKQSTLNAFDHQDYQFDDLVENVSVKRDTSRNPIFDVMFNMQNQADYTGDLSEFNNDELIHTSATSKFDFTFTAVDYGDQLLLSFAYCTRLFKSESIERFIKYFTNLLNAMIIDPLKKISEIEILSLAEKHQLLHEFNDTKAGYPKDKTLHQLFEEQVEKTPNNIAIVFQDEQISYSELSERSNSLALYLVNQGVLKEDYVGIHLDRSLELYIGILGVLKTGKAYIPIDVSMPESRIEYMIKDSNLKTILTQFNNNFQGVENSINFGSIPITNSSIVDLKLEVLPTSPVYVIYTSGSTGLPKGVVVNHKNVVNLIAGQIKEFNIQYDENIFQFSNISFDASVEQIWIALLTGSTLIGIDKLILHDITKVENLLNRQLITHLHSVPSYLKELEFKNLRKLRRVISGGDSCPLDLVSKVGKCLFYNEYGPTETTVTSIELKLERGSKDLEKLSIGKPLANTQVCILSKSKKLQPIGVPGELLISGDGLGFGYLNNPELTLEKFIEHPFKEGERLYRTGDLARWLPDGNIEFLGRIDNQVKIRGFRIELDEIKNTLLKHEQVKECLVISIEENEDKYLCAYIVCEAEFDQEIFRSYLTGLLPNYMIPSYFVEIEKLPMTPNGKVNLRALPSPEIRTFNDYIAPSNEIEEKLVEIWSDILNKDREDISVDSNFFEIGGNSMKIILLNQKINDCFNVKLEVAEMFRLSTINLLATRIGENDKEVIITSISDTNIEEAVDTMDEYFKLVGGAGNE